MPVYHANTPEGRRITSVKLDGREVMKELLVKTANTDEGWLDVYKFATDEHGRRRIVMTEWKPVGYDRRQEREPVIERLHGKVEVELGTEPEPTA